jgi:hypothetical protein
MQGRRFFELRLDGLRGSDDASECSYEGHGWSEITCVGLLVQVELAYATADRPSTTPRVLKGGALWMLGGRYATSHGTGIDITSPRLKSA